MAALIDLHAVRAVVFDAVGTLIAPDPPPAEVYVAIAREHGVEIELAAVHQRFLTAFRREDEADRAASWRTNSERERQRWRSIVAATLPEVSDQEQCFQTLWRRFAEPTSWRVLPMALDWIGLAAARRLTIGVASNFDDRLRSVLAGLPELPFDRRLIISADVGWRKPAPRFFAAVAAAMACPPEQILMIGDDAENDVSAARAAGLQAILVTSR